MKKEELIFNRSNPENLKEYWLDDDTRIQICEKTWKEADKKFRALIKDIKKGIIKIE